MKIQPVATGFKADIDVLLKKFEASRNATFEEFAKIWREMKFSLIFWGRRHDLELREFLDDCFVILADEISESDSTVVRRIGALFLAYAMYTKQGSDQRIRMRVTADSCRTMQAVVDEAKTSACKDAVDVWREMLAIGMFDFIHHTKLFGPVYIKSNFPGNESIPPRIAAAKESLSEQKRWLERIDKAQRKYNKTLSSQSSTVKKKLTEGLECIKPVTGLNNKLRRFYKSVADEPDKMYTHQLVGTAPDEASTVEEDIGTKRRRLKNRAMDKTSK